MAAPRAAEVMPGGMTNPCKDRHDATGKVMGAFVEPAASSNEWGGTSASRRVPISVMPDLFPVFELWRGKEEALVRKRTLAPSVDRFDDRRPGRDLGVEMAIDRQIAGEAAHRVDFGRTFPFEGRIAR